MHCRGLQCTSCVCVGWAVPSWLHDLQEDISAHHMYRLQQEEILWTIQGEDSSLNCQRG